MLSKRKFVMALLMAGLLSSGCGSGGVESLPEEQKNPDSGLAAAEKLKQSIPTPGARKKSNR